MTTNRSFWTVLALAFTGLIIFSLSSIALLAVAVDELGESGQLTLNIFGLFFPDRDAVLPGVGDEFTGEATAWLFGLSCLPVAFDLLSRLVISLMPIGETIKRIIRRINLVQRKYLMPFHTWLSILALGVGFVHLLLSTCAGNPLPEFGLILAGILVITGLLFKWKPVPNNIRKAFYKFHASLIVSTVLLVILFTGHAVMGLD